MLNKHSQNVSDKGQAIQASGDVTINNGISSVQMIEIMSELSVIASRLTTAAIAEADRRLSDFREEIIKKFADEKSTNARAFMEPDFQYMLGDAQTAYARSGDPAVRDTLVDIIARRSMAENATREALALNDAAARAPRLTKSEFAALSLNYMVLHVINGTPTDAETFGKYINNELMPFVRAASRENSSFWHLSSQSCATIGIAGSSLRDMWAESYGGLLGFGFDIDRVINMVPIEKRDFLESVLCPSLRNPNKVQPAAQNREIYKESYADSGFTAMELDALWSAHVQTIPPADIMVEMLEPISPDVRELFDFWKETSIGSLDLNSVGIAIAHANAVRVIGFNVPLGVWIK